jgi:ribosomal protein S18 acetylase RimI-like enzyme
MTKNKDFYEYKSVIFMSQNGEVIELYEKIKITDINQIEKLAKEAEVNRREFFERNANYKNIRSIKNDNEKV